MCDGSGARTSSARERVLRDVSVTVFVMSPGNLRAGQAGRASCGRIRRNEVRPRYANRDEHIPHQSVFSNPPALTRFVTASCLGDERNSLPHLHRSTSMRSPHPVAPLVDADLFVTVARVFVVDGSPARHHPPHRASAHLHESSDCAPPVMASTAFGVHGPVLRSLIPARTFHRRY